METGTGRVGIQRFREREERKGTGGAVWEFWVGFQKIRGGWVFFQFILVGSVFYSIFQKNKLVMRTVIFLVVTN